LHTKSKLLDNIFLTGSDPNTNSFVRDWVTPSRSAEGKRRRGHTWWMLVAGKGLGEDVTNGAAARPVVDAREGRTRAERVREKGKGGKKQR
jgi:hypothetical protein